jgi:hypothetical protein
LRSLRLNERLVSAIMSERGRGRFSTFEGMRLRLVPVLGNYAGLISQLDQYQSKMTF